MKTIVQPGQGRLLAVPCLCLFLLACASVLYVAAPGLYRQMLSLIIINPFQTPFIDLEYVFTTTSCWQHGVDVYMADPCDRLNRVMNLSPLLIHLPFLAIDRAWTVPIGLVLAVLFCIAPYRLCSGFAWWKIAVFGLATLSPACVFAVERGNVDLIVYFTALLAGETVLYGRIARAAGYGGIFASGLLLKLYPVIGLILVAREKLRVCIGFGVGAVAVLVVFFLLFHDELRRMAHNIPQNTAFGDMVGAIQLPAGLRVVLRTLLSPIAGAGFAQSAAEHPLLPFAALLFLLCGVAAIAVFLMHSATTRAGMAALPPRALAWFVLGAAFLTGCFFTGQSVSYRCVHFLLVLPALLWLCAAATPHWPRLFSRITTCAIILVMYRVAVIGLLSRHHADPGNSVVAALIWLGFELLWWWITGVLCGLLGCFLIESRSVRAVRTHLFVSAW